MGCRACIVNLETNKKVYSQWGGGIFNRASSFQELKREVKELYNRELEDHSDYNLEEEGITSYEDQDVVEDLDLHIERVYVLEEDEFRGYTRTMLNDRDKEIPDDKVIFKFSDPRSFWKARHI